MLKARKHSSKTATRKVYSIHPILASEFFYPTDACRTKMRWNICRNWKTAVVITKVSSRWSSYSGIWCEWFVGLNALVSIFFSVANQLVFLKFYRIQLSDLNDLKSAIDHDPNLPCSTICLSLVDQEMQSLFIGEKFIHHDAWLLITRFDTGVNPLSMMFHCASLPEGSSLLSLHD